MRKIIFILVIGMLAFSCEEVDHCTYFQIIETDIEDDSYIDYFVSEVREKFEDRGFVYSETSPRYIIEISGFCTYTDFTIETVTDNCTYGENEFTLYETKLSGMITMHRSNRTILTEEFKAEEKDELENGESFLLDVLLSLVFNDCDEDTDDCEEEEDPDCYDYYVDDGGNSTIGDDLSKVAKSFSKSATEVLNAQY